MNMKQAMQTFILLSALLLFPDLTWGQLHEEDLHEYFSRVKSGLSTTRPESALKAGKPKSHLSALKPYLNDTLPTVRAAAADCTHFVTIRASDPSDRMAGVDLLLQTYREDDASHNSTRLTWLEDYTREDYSAFARNAVRDLVRREPAYFDRILRLAGFLQLSDLIPDIWPWTQTGNPSAIRWSALICLARLGDAAATTAVLARAKNLPLNDDVVYRLFPDLIYTRSPDIIAFVVEALHQNEPNCLAANGESQVRIDCGYRIMEQLAPVIEGFPVEVDISGDLKTDDYPGALERIRSWFRRNPDYTILDHTW